VATYSVCLTRTMSQVIEVEADDLRTAVAQALEQEDLEPNISNSFEGDGETEVYSVDSDGARLYEQGRDDTNLIFEQQI
jgi:hypothetical protein